MIKMNTQTPAGTGLPNYDSLCLTSKIQEDYLCTTKTLEPTDCKRTLGRVVQLDRSLPLVCVEDGLFRAEHATKLIKSKSSLATVGDWVIVDFPDVHQNAVISAILPRKNSLERPSKSRKGQKQVLAANIDIVFIVVVAAQAADELDHLERQLVMSYQSGAVPVIVLSKADDIAKDDIASNDRAGTVNNDRAKTTYNDRAKILSIVSKSACEVPVILESAQTGEGIDELISQVPKGKLAVLLGKSGVGKSSLINAMLGDSVRRTGEVRAKDNQGRHTTIARTMVLLPNGGLLIDSPGLRSFKLTNSSTGIEMAFPDIIELSNQCKFRDCAHTKEPGCAVNEAVASGILSKRRLNSYLSISSDVIASN